MTRALSVLALLLAGCSTPSRIAIRDAAFIELPAGRPFHPWGLNYDRDFRMRLLEDYWLTEWPTVERDFAEMKRLGANVVRVHLQVAQFMTAPERMNDASLAQLRRLLALAENTGLRLDVTGLACYRRADVPTWYADLDEQSRWQAQSVFWAHVAKACADHPRALFCYDLVNEPSVPGKPIKDWLTGELGGFTYCQYIALDPKGRDRTQIAIDWIKKLTASIRRHDPHTPITVGLLPFPTGTGFDAAVLAPHLDFVAVHYYPDKAPPEKQADFLKRFHTSGKPLIVEEIFPLKCDTNELAAVIEKSTPLVTGWIGFYWGKPAAELEKSKALNDVLTARWLRFFQNQHPPR
jgi:hypothetical protein